MHMFTAVLVCMFVVILKVEIYMFLWAIQCILFWLSVMGYLQRSSSYGPLLKMIGLMVVDVLNWLLLWGLLLASTTAMVFTIVSTDLEDYEEGEDEAGFGGAITTSFLYSVQTLFGQQDWLDVAGANDEEYLGNARAYLLEYTVLIGTFVGTVILLNLLIAMLVARYNHVSRYMMSHDLFLSEVVSWFLLHF